MRYFIYIAALFLIMAGVIYILLFSGTGNSIMRPFVETRLGNSIEGQVNLEEFMLRTDRFAFKIVLDGNSTISVKGTLDLFNQTLDADYDLNILDLSKLEHLINYSLMGPLSTSGSIKGGRSSLIIKGTGNVAAGKTQYKVNLVDFKPKAIDLVVEEAHIEKIFYMLKLKGYATGRLNVTADLDTSDPANLRGDADIKIYEGLFDQQALIDTPSSGPQVPLKFRLDIQTLLHKNTLITSMEFESDIARFVSKKSIFNVETSSIDSDFLISVPDLGKVQFVIDRPLKGSVNAQGTVKGCKERLVVAGSTDLFEGDSDYTIELAAYSPEKIHLVFDGIKIDSILHTLNQPGYANGYLDLAVDIRDMDLHEMETNGLLHVRVYQGIINGEAINKQFNISFPEHIAFETDIHSKLEKNMAVSKINFSSDIVGLSCKTTKINLKTAALSSDYTLRIPGLDRLNFITGRRMKGSVEINGEVKKEKALFATGRGGLMGGEMDFELNKDILNVRLKDIQTLEATEMFNYPNLFDSNGDIIIKYDLIAQRGDMKAELREGRILPGQVMARLSDMAKFDINQELYELTTIETKIKDKIILSDLNMKSRFTTIRAEDAAIDLNKERIDAKLVVVIKGSDIIIRIKGAIDKPKVSIDASALLRDKARKKLEKKLGKELPDSLQEPIKKLFDLLEQR